MLYVIGYGLPYFVAFLNTIQHRACYLCGTHVILISLILEVLFALLQAKRDPYRFRFPIEMRFVYPNIDHLMYVLSIIISLYLKFASSFVNCIHLSLHIQIQSI